MLDGFWTGSKYDDTRTKKQKLEQRIRSSVLNMIIDRNQSFLKTARKHNTYMIVNNRDGLVEKFTHNDINYISIPTSLEDKFDCLNEYEAEMLCDEYVKAISTDTLEIDNEVVNYEYNKYTGDNIAEQVMKEPLFTKRTTEQPNEEETQDVEDGKGRCSTRGISESSEDDAPQGNQEAQMLMTQENNDVEIDFQDTELNPDCKLPKDVGKTGFYSTTYKVFNDKREPKLKALANQVVKSFNGRISKLKTVIPSKRLNSKAMTIDSIEKIYQNKKGNNGKHLKVNLIIDMSGSMDGAPVRNAIEMVYIFNEIALAGKVTGCVIWSEDSSRCKVNFPMPREFVRNMSNTGGSEGLGRNLEIYKDELKKSDINICMTDGQLCDDPIMKSLYEKEGIDIIGVYVNSKAKDLTKFTNSLDRWFSRSVVRRSTEELCEKLISYGLRKKHK